MHLVSISSSHYKTRISRNILMRLKDAILGRRYELNVVFASVPLMRRLNRDYRGKDEPTDILSFPLSKNEGEIFIAPAIARRETKRFRMPFKNFIIFLLIHGMLHLKGMGHGSRMESEERKFRARFGI